MNSIACAPFDHHGSTVIQGRTSTGEAQYKFVDKPSFVSDCIIKARATPGSLHSRLKWASTKWRNP